jgi:23S rRNA (cytosine1962-C5)-methyltransferase
VPPCVLFEDKHLLVINKPAGVNTHAPGPWAGEGIFEWLRDREPRWASLAIIHRLDKDTSGIMVFGLSPGANKSLTAQFARRQAEKRYLFLTDRIQSEVPAICRSSIERAGQRYVSRPMHTGGNLAETRFTRTRAGDWPEVMPAVNLPEGTQLIEAVPLTGRTHQIRVHAAATGFPVLGDILYGGTPAGRVYLHSAQLRIRHPASGAPMKFVAPLNFLEDPRVDLRHLMIEPGQTNAFRMVHGAADGWPDCYIDRIGDYLLVQTPGEITAAQKQLAERLSGRSGLKGVYHRLLTRHARGRGVEASPELIMGLAAPPTIPVMENGLSFELSLQEGYSVGLFLDQRENRRRLASGHIGAGFGQLRAQAAVQLRGGQERPRSGLELLNTFSYTCGFSVAAARLGMRATSLDLSKKYLDWGKRNFLLNGIAPEDHDFIFGDVFEWLNRFQRKRRTFDMIILDPPTFSQSRESGVFRAEADYGKLVASAAGLLKNAGVLLASTNAAKWEPADFAGCVRTHLATAGWRIVAEKYVPQPMDFPMTREEPGHLKTLWVRVGR